MAKRRIVVKALVALSFIVIVGYNIAQVQHLGLFVNHSTADLDVAGKRVSLSPASVSVTKRNYSLGHNGETRTLCPRKCMNRDCSLHFRLLSKSAEWNSAECFITVNDVKVPCHKDVKTGILIIHVTGQCIIHANLTFVGPTASAFNWRRNMSLHEYAKEIPKGGALLGLVTTDWVDKYSESVQRVFEFLNLNKEQYKKAIPDHAVAFIWKKGIPAMVNNFVVQRTVEDGLSWKAAVTLGVSYTVSTENVSWNEIYKKHSSTEKSAFHRPDGCGPTGSVALIIPYRDREQHLRIFLNNIIPFLKMQGLRFIIYVVEQAEPVIFNRAALMNIGYAEAQKTAPHQAYVFHDVDKVPQDLCNIYTCSQRPRHLMLRSSSNNYSAMYSSFVGGALCLTEFHMQGINGFSNVFYGWGGEDDEIYGRLDRKQYYIERYPPEIGRYKVFTHAEDKGNPRSHRSLAVSQYHSLFMDSDGLSNLQYTLRRHVTTAVYHHLTVHIDGPTSTNTIGEYFAKEVNKSEALLSQRRKELAKYQKDIVKQRVESRTLWERLKDWFRFRVRSGIFTL